MQENRTHFEANIPEYFRPPARDKNLAIASLVLGIISCFTFGLALVGTIAGIITGVMALKNARTDPSRYDGEGLAIAGILTSILSVVITAAVVFSALVTIPKVFANQRRVANETIALKRVKYIAQSEKTYHEYKRPGSYATLEELKAENMIDHGESADGYKYRVDINGNKFEAYADPEKYPDTGFHSYYVSTDGLIHFANKKGEDASNSDPQTSPTSFNSTPTRSRKSP